MVNKSTGIIFGIVGVGGFILPFFGLQFRILYWLGEAQWIVALAFIVLGIILFVKGK